MSNQVIQTDNATVVIQMNSQDCDEGQDKNGPHHDKGFLKVQPKALGTVQIMTGVMFFLFGIMLSTTVDYQRDFTVFSGITYWGSLIYIIAGSLSVAVENKLRPCVVKASLVMNVFSAITAGIAIILMSVQLALALRSCSYSYSSYGSYCSYFKVLGQGFTGIFLVFSILQFITSICISVFACKAISDISDSSVINVSLINY